MRSPEIEEVRDLIRRSYEEDFGYRATNREVYEKVLGELTKGVMITGRNAHLVSYGFRKFVASQVTAVFAERGKHASLPFAPVVNDKRQHVPFDLMSEPEMRYVCTSYVHEGAARIAQARRAAKFAHSRYGVRYVIDGIDLLGESEAA